MNIITEDFKCVFPITGLSSVPTAERKQSSGRNPRKLVSEISAGRSVFYLDDIYENINNHLYLQIIGKFIYIIIGKFREMTGEKQR